MSDPENTRPFDNSAIPSDWMTSVLDNVTKRGSGHTPDKKHEDYYNGGIKWISLADSYRLDKGLISETEIEISALGIRKSSAVLHPAGTVLMSRDAGVGKSAVMAVDMAVSQHFIVWKCGDELHNWFLYYWLQAKKGYFERQAVGSTIKTIGLPLFKKLTITHPQYPEQKAIAHVLGLMDNAINQNNQLIAQKELRKKWLMQNLLTGKKRLREFTGEWNVQRLADLLKPASRPVDKPKEAFIALGIRSHGKGTFLKHDFRPEKIDMETLYVVRENDLIINITFAWEGAIAIVGSGDDGALVSHRFPTFVFREGKANVEYLRHFILQKRFRYLLGVISPGGAGRNRVLDKKDFLKMNFEIPDFEEQLRIGQILSAADKEIQLLKTKTEKLREQKKGVMQQLLTGKKRLRIKGQN